MRLHPPHPMSVHAPIACILFTPLADLGAHISQRADAWILGAITSAGAALFGLVAAMLGALDFERAYARARRTVIAHASFMAAAATSATVSLFGRVDQQLAIVTPAPPWTIAAGVAALILMIAGAFFGGELVYRHGVNVGTDA